MLKIKQTKDGSDTLFDEKLNESYHSIGGAISESEHVFIDKGLREVQKKNKGISIFELGFGTGLNCLLTWKHKNSGTNIYYESIDVMPIDKEIIEEINYRNEIDLPKEIYDNILLSEWDENVKIDNDFMLKKVKGKIQEYKFTKSFNLVYFDAFAPSKQPEMWEKEVVEKISTNMNKGGILVTYSCTGNFKRLLKSLNFEVEILEGAVGKREMIRARKI